MSSTSKGHLNESLLERFIQLISNRTGWQIRQQDKESLSQKILARMVAIKISVPEYYYQILETESNLSKSEWHELATQLTTPETYFFRDQGQFTLLRNRIIPELISRQQNVFKSLRIWSAGCSTGEEAYSLAILIKELIPDYQLWNIFILGTDINPEVVEKARRGHYNAWSFRVVDGELQQQYFQQVWTEWKLDEQIRSMVTFQYGNLIKDPFPNNYSNIYNMDLIICRNVFVYFTSEAIAQVINKFYNTLKPGGYLLTGHTEIQGQELGLLQTQIYPESIIYQRTEQELNNSLETIPLVTKVTALKNNNIYPEIKETIIQSSEAKLDSQNFLLNSASKFTISPPTTEAPNIKIIFQEIENLFKNKQYKQAIKKTEELLTLNPDYFNAVYLLGKIYANLGDYKKATSYCKQAIKLNSMAIEPYYLLAHISEEQGDLEGAKSLFKTIIYLSPGSVNAYIELSAIYDIEGDKTRADKMRNVAMEMLRKLPASTLIEGQSKLTAGELLVKLKKIS